MTREEKLNRRSRARIHTSRAIVDPSMYIDAGQFIINDPFLGSTIRDLYNTISPTIPFREWIIRRSQIEGRVCRVEFQDPTGISPEGTGFLVAPNIVMTSWHVIDFLFGKTQAEPSKLQLRFDYTTSEVGRVCHLAQNWLVACNPKQDATKVSNTDLDYALLRLAESPGCDVIRGGTERGKIDLPEKSPGLHVGEPLAIVQHPDGEPLKLAVGLRGVKKLNLPARVTYEVNTEGGSSGAPVFNKNWELVALHRGQVKNTRLNEGIPIQSIVAELPGFARAALAFPRGIAEHSNPA
jgi:hypothetical protein